MPVCASVVIRAFEVLLPPMSQPVVSVSNPPLVMMLSPPSQTSGSLVVRYFVPASHPTTSPDCCARSTRSWVTAILSPTIARWPS